MWGPPLDILLIGSDDTKNVLTFKDGQRQQKSSTPNARFSPNIVLHTSSGVDYFVVRKDEWLTTNFMFTVDYNLTQYICMIYSN